MLTWMQTHKKWLIVTMWISVIAFVGAGAVGWGSYDYNKGSNSIAIVGGKEIKYQDLQNEYNKMYSYYARMFGNNFNQEMAKNFKLEAQAYNNIINQFLLLNFADENGLVVTNADVIKEIQSIPNFQKDGKFDTTLYKKVLLDNNLKIKDFESDIKRTLLIKKVYELTNIPATTSESNAVSASMNVEDEISIMVINKDSIKVDEDPAKIKAYWEVNKTKYMTDKVYKVRLVDIATLNKQFDETTLTSYYKDNITQFDNKKFEDVKGQVVAQLNDKETKTNANKVFYDLKKDEYQEYKEIDISDGSLMYGALLEEISKIQVGETIKPVKTANGYQVAKLVAVQNPVAKSYEDAAVEVKVDYVNDEKTKGLENVANSRLAMFRGQNVGYINLQTKSISGLNAQESGEVVKSVFSNTEKKGLVTLIDKAILYEITNQKISSNLELVKSNILNIKSDILNNALVNYLKTKYEIENYYKIEG